jgi:hypothetical protein
MRHLKLTVILLSAGACAHPSAPQTYGPPPVFLAPSGPTPPSAVWSPPSPAPATAAGGDPFYDALMRYRAAAGLAPIPRSASLTRVAQAHVADLEAHPPDGARCNPHSWSNAGPWSACCYTPDQAQAACMWNKPKELTPYTGNGFEVAAMTTGTMTADVAIASWDGSGAHKPVILNQGQWTQQWRAVGAAMSQHYAVAWFGWDADPSR